LSHVFSLLTCLYNLIHFTNFACLKKRILGWCNRTCLHSTTYNEQGSKHMFWEAWINIHAWLESTQSVVNQQGTEKAWNKLHEFKHASFEIIFHQGQHDWPILVIFWIYPPDCLFLVWKNFLLVLFMCLIEYGNQSSFLWLNFQVSQELQPFNDFLSVILWNQSCKSLKNSASDVTAFLPAGMLQDRGNLLFLYCI